MRGSMGSSPGPVDARHRISGTFDDTSKRRSHRTKDSNEVEKPITLPCLERSTGYKLRTLKLVLVIIICGTFFLICFSPSLYQSNNPSHSGSGSRFVDVGWIWETTTADPCYTSHLDINWIEISETIESFTNRRGRLNVFLLNFNTTEIKHWQQILPSAEAKALNVKHADSSITWETLYPEWIDEEEESEVPVCPSLPVPKFPKHTKPDIVAVKLPCNRSREWMRDVARLHLQLSAAKIAANFLGSQQPVHVLFVTECFPIPNLFMCKERIMRNGNTWLYKPELRTLKEKLQLPVGSCELPVPLKAKERPQPEPSQRVAYVTILHSANMYVCGAITAAQSIRQAGSTRDLVILVDDSISEYHRGGLEAAGWKIRTIQRIRNPKAERDAYNEWNYSKFRLWQLTDYDKIIFIDADLLVLRDIDFLFSMPEISAIGNNATLFNSGVMVVEPSNCTFELLMEHINEIQSYNGGDQGYLNEIFTWWHRIPKHMNFLKHFWVGDEEEKKQMKTRLFGADPPILYVLHYLGNKPWLCFRDYDCNWNNEILLEFASDVAHTRWWKVHDAMPRGLQKFCLLRTKQKAALEWDRRQAEKANFKDGHWKRKIKDPRLKTCFEEDCHWKSMLLHWGETNWTDSGSPPPKHKAHKAESKTKASKKALHSL